MLKSCEEIELRQRTQKRLSIRSATLLFVFVTVVTWKDLSAIYVYPQTTTVFENETVQFTAVFDVLNVTDVLWRKNGSGYIKISNENCAKIYNGLDNVTHTIKCNATSNSLIITNVKRNKTGQTWFFQRIGSITEYEATYYVNVPVNKVELEAQGQLDVRANNNLTVTCRSSYSRPNVTILLMMSDNIAVSNYDSTTTYNDDRDGLWQAVTTFKFSAYKEYNNKSVFCFAYNHPGKNTTSERIWLNVQFPPSFPPRIANFDQTIYNITEGTEGNLMCYIDISNPPANLMWSCQHTNGSVSMSTLNDTHQKLQFTLTRGTEASCTCMWLFDDAENSSTTVKFNVLYKPDAIWTSLYTSDGNASDILCHIMVIEKVKLTFSCVANGNPKPHRYVWSGLNSSNTSELELVPARQNGNITCETFNTMIETEGNTIKRGNFSKSYAITVLYPPDLNIQKYNETVTVLEGDYFDCRCEVIGGSTTYQNISWTSYGTAGDTISEFTIANVSRSMQDIYACTLNYTLTPTYEKDVHGSKEKKLKLDVLYPPEHINTNLTVNGETNYTIASNFSVVENTSLTMDCSASGNPTPSHFNWTGPGNKTNSSSLIWMASRNETKETHFTCNAYSWMHLTNGSSILGYQKRTYNISVLYPPDIQPILDYRVLEQQDFSTTCEISDGKTTIQSLRWILKTKEISTFANLTLTNVTRNFSGTYTCQLNFTLEPTYGKMIKDAKSTSFYLDVLYPAENVTADLQFGSVNAPDIKHRFSVKENKTQTLVLNCSAGGNPTPKDITWEGHLGRVLYLNVSRIITGNHTCVAKNEMNSTIAMDNSKAVGRASQSFEIDVLYPPSILQMRSHYALEYDEFNAACDMIEGRTTNMSKLLLSQKGEHFPFANLTINSVERTDAGTYTCLLNYTMDPTYGETVKELQNTSFRLDVLYPPEDIQVHLSLGNVKKSNISKMIIVVENSSTVIILNCSAGGNPLPSYISWTGIRYVSSSVLNETVTRRINGNITCVAKNTMSLTYKTNETKIGMANKTYEVKVLYSPVFQNTSQHDIIEWQDMHISCTIPGRTTNQTIKWFKSKPETVLGEENTLTVSNVSRNATGNITCELSYTMVPTYGDVLQEEDSKMFKLNVLYPPEEVGANVRGILSQEVTIPDSLFITENGSRELFFNCTSRANPDPRNVSWTGPRGNQTSHLYIKANRNFRGIYTCHAQNEMIPTKGDPQTGYRNRSYNIDFLYPPTLREYTEENVTIGTNISLNCIKQPGNPDNVTVCWTRKNKTCNRTLIILNVTIDDSGFYNCTVAFHARPTFGENISQIFSSSVFINVMVESSAGPGVGDGPESSFVGAAVGGALAGVVVVFATLVTMYIVKKRRLLSTKGDGEKYHAYENIGFSHDPKQDKRLPAPPPPEEPEVEKDGVINNIAETEFYNTEEENPYANDPKVVEILKISVHELYTYVRNKSKEFFHEEFEKFPKGLVSTIACTFARKPENLPLNRYQGIYPYDHSRVQIAKHPAFFINANYIDGYTRNREYIASLGPTERHTLGFKMFWNMVWYEKSDVIVMLTNLTEPSGMKCEQYWPDYGKSMEVDDFLIQSDTEEIYAEYTVRTFTVLKGEESRAVTQLHYTAWPDKTVPESVISLIEFRQRVKAVPTRSLGPLVVHCSAGVGRTGTYIALDRLVEEGKSTDHVNVFECVMSMRQQRVNMVQTPEQYVYLHQALVYCLALDIEPVTAVAIGEYLQTTSNNVFSQLYQQLKQTVEKESDEYIEAQNKHASFIDWNRRRADIPGDRHRVLLSLDKEYGQSNYINAVYLASFLRLDHFIIAQSPLPKTVEDFVGMLYQESSACIVALDDYRQKGTNNTLYLPAENEQFTYGYFTIFCLSVEVKPAYVVRKLKLSHEGKHEQGEKNAYHFEFTAWKHDEKLPNDPKMFVQFVREVEDYAKESTEEKPHVVVHCMSGSERSGLFCSVSNLIQKMEQEQQVSVVNMLRRVRERRRTAISSMEQLKFCYHAVNAFVKKSQHLSTRKKPCLVHHETNIS